MENNFYSESETTTLVAEPIKEKLASMSEKDINFIVLAVESPFFNIDKQSYELHVCGKQMIDWVINACSSVPTIKRVSFKFDLLKEIKPLLNKSEWTIVLFSDTPLLTKKTVENAFNIAEQKGLNVLKLTRGYVFNTEYVSRVEEVFGIETYYLEEEDFITVTNFKQLSITRDIMKNRICEYFMKQGVDILDPSTTYIDGEVSIGRNTTISPNNSLFGRVQIGSDCKIDANNILEDCVVYDGCILENSTIKNSVIGENSAIVNTIIEDSVLLGKENTLVQYSNVNKVQTKSRLDVNNATLNTVKCEGCVIVKNGARICGENGSIRMFGNNIVKENASIVKSVSIGENVEVEPNRVVTANIPAVKK